METWTWGPFILQKSMLVVIAAVAAGYVLSRLRLKGSSIGRTFGAIVSNALLMWVVSWKLSILVFDPGSVLSNPMSLLYFSGGDKGVWLATLLSGIYVWLSAKKAKLNAAIYTDSVLVSVIGGYAVYAALIFFYGRGEPSHLGTQGAARGGPDGLLARIQCEEGVAAPPPANGRLRRRICAHRVAGRQCVG